jgi:hypothetical protein
MRLRLLAIALGAVLLAGLGVVLLSHLRSPEQKSLVESVEAAPAVSVTNIEARFAVLSKRHSNQCGLEAESLQALARGGRLQGACCSPMVLRRYREQLRGLERYRAEDAIPPDPYDISVPLARRLIGYRDSISLDASDQAVYERATQMAEEHGPCCCHCWRWDAFEGQAKFLISKKSYASRQIAAVWDLEDGCGGDET